MKKIMTRNLYPLKFKPILKERIWGGRKLDTILNKNLGEKENIGESWEISGVSHNISIVQNGFLKNNSLNELIEVYMGDLVGEKVFQKHGKEFPLLIKFIDAQDDLSIQVHPDDKIAAKLHNSNGKTEMWYVLQADDGSKLINGFKKDIDKQEYIKAVENNTIEDLLAKHPVKSGDVFFMPAGRVHAIGAGIMIAEIQQTSDITYRIYDYNRRDKDGKPRELHTDLAVEAIDYKAYDNYQTKYSSLNNQSVEIINSPYFLTRILEADKAVVRDYYSLDSFVILICIEGAFDIKYGNEQYESLIKGETTLIPADMMEITLLPKTPSKLLEVYMP